MKSITVSIDEDDVELLEDLQDEHDLANRSAAMRRVFEQYRENENLRSELQDLNMEIQRLQRERRQLLETREENQELVKFAEEQRSVVREQREEDRRRRSANILKRTWWKLAGEPDLETADG